MIERSVYKELEGEDVIIETTDGTILLACYEVIDVDELDGETEDSLTLLGFEIIKNTNKDIQDIYDLDQLLGLLPSEIKSIKPAPAA